MDDGGADSLKIETLFSVRIAHQDPNGIDSFELLCDLVVSSVAKNRFDAEGFTQYVRNGVGLPRLIAEHHNLPRAFVLSEPLGKTHCPRLVADVLLNELNPL